MLKRKRKETEATRKRRAALARERQNQFGRWESNAQKARARKARRTSLRLAPLFERSRAKKAAVEASAVRDARGCGSELESAQDEASVIDILARLDGLEVSPLTLRRTMIGRKVNDAMKRFPAVGSACKRLLTKWRAAFRRDVAKAKEVATSPSKAVLKAASSSSASSSAPVSSVAQRGGSSAASQSVAPSKQQEASPRVDKALVATSQGASANKRQRSVSVSSSSSTSSSSSDSSSGESPRQAPLPLTTPPAPRPPPKKPLKQKRITAFLAPAGA
mmetsp:Transcript_14427/g.23661  ORF Transcript_14427/g.23661 Transcript_14427/m.23661 type:complete len:276 (+) Transcript_14427:62-889(+)|eukprot:CAMPEP_0169151588 /NCGR_PEP_ID=MMETSP1015-20121227/50939_1 /TAXON_ID=342587 /ORGANISM="Karlodinium micrum, Strain CCMP2283" /LENGTH=275 /DNA_ID=CAMNT_0009221083 /DNA_START=59 /DNA_END=886 /DNA_ORIENTATION=+